MLCVIIIYFIFRVSDFLIFDFGIIYYGVNFNGNFNSVRKVFRVIIEEVFFNNI